MDQEEENFRCPGIPMPGNMPTPQHLRIGMQELQDSQLTPLLQCLTSGVQDPGRSNSCRSTAGAVELVEGGQEQVQER